MTGNGRPETAATDAIEKPGSEKLSKFFPSLCKNKNDITQSRKKKFESCL